MDNKIYIIILNYNSANDTIECIKSIKENELELKYKIIVIDNKSNDNSVEILKKCKNIELIEAKDNGGFANGNNIGIKYAIEKGAEYILLLNNDTVIAKNAINILIKKMQEDNSLGIVGSRIMYYNNRNVINYCGGDINWLKATTIHKGYKSIFRDRNNEFEYTNFVTGCCMLIKKEVFDKVEYLPEEYFMYYEDADFCVQVCNAGYKLGVCTNSVIYHKISASSGGEESAFSIKWGTRNRIIFMNKYKKYTKSILTIIFFYITRMYKIFIYKIQGQYEKSEAIKKGIKEGRKYVKEIKMGGKV